MPFQKKKEPVSLYTRTKVALLRLIISSSQQGLDRLPAEDELGKQLGVSRMVIRDVLGELETRGYVTRKRGVGTRINSYLFSAQPRLDEQVDFEALISAAGYQSSCTFLDDRWVDEGEPGILDERFCLEPGEKMLFLERIFHGNQRPLVYSRAYIKESIFTIDYSKWQGYRDLSIFEFLETFCDKQVHITLAELNLCQADPLLSQQLKVQEGTPLFLMRDTGYTAEGEAIIRASAYLCPEILPVKLIRHRI
ncbi:MAG: GntR family transcriptional regulator [Oscillospiraceae bacterium]|nr:GntR family transcriptional regulator [Oscillospiraceae bacterium]